MTTSSQALSGEEVIDLATRLSPAEKRKLLRVLIPDMDRFEKLVDYGEERARSACERRGLDWDGLTADQREQLVDHILHEP